jgi:hypothetical protein
MEILHTRKQCQSPLFCVFSIDSVILQVQFKRHGDVTDKGERQNKEEKVNRTKRRTVRHSCISIQFLQRKIYCINIIWGWDSFNASFNDF